MAERTSPEETTVENPSQNDRSLLRRISWLTGLTGVIMGLLIGSVAGWATLNVSGVAGVVFVGMWVGSAIYLARKPNATLALGTGLYILAGELVLLPIVFYIPTILDSGEGAAGAGAFIGGILGLVVWGFAFLVVGIVTFALGYFISKRGKRSVDVA